MIKALDDPIAGAGGLAADGANRHQREQGRIFGNGGVYHPVVIGQMAAEQGGVDLADAALAELLAEGGIDRLVTGNHHQPGGAEIQAMHQGAAGKRLYQPVMHGIEVLRILPRQAEQPAGLIDQHQMIVLPERLYRGVARRGNKGIDNGRHQADRRKKEEGMIPNLPRAGEWACRVAHGLPGLRGRQAGHEVSRLRFPLQVHLSFQAFCCWSR